MRQVITAVDFELDLILFELLDAIDDVTIVARPADDVELLALCRTGSADIVIVGRYFPGLDADVLIAIAATGTAILGFGDDAEVLAELGVSRTVDSRAAAETVEQALAEVLDTTIVPPRPRTAPGNGPRPGRIVTVWGTGSSPGRTVTASNLGDLAARAGHRVVLVDADTVSASVATTLGLGEESSQVASLCRMEAESRGPSSAGDVPHAAVAENFAVVTGLTKAERWPELRPAALTAVLHRLASIYELVLVDVSDRVDPDDDFADPYYDRHGATRAALDAADEVLVLAAGDPIGLQRLVKLLGTERAEKLRSTMRIIITKVRAAAVGVPATTRIREVLERFTGRQVDFFLSDDRDSLDAALLDGRTLAEAAPRSPLTAEFVEIVSTLLPARSRRESSGRRESRRRRAGKRSQHD